MHDNIRNDTIKIKLSIKKVQVTSTKDKLRIRTLNIHTKHQR